MSTVNPLPSSAPVSADFFRCLVSNMRSGVLAIDCGGRIVLLNDEALRLFRLPATGFSGQRFEHVLGEHPDILRVLSGVFDRPTLPSRAEIRMKSTDTVVGYSLSLVRTEAGAVIGAAMFFKDLTYVEQMEERERLRDRLAAVGEMAAVMAHEIKNPLAGIEVLAGLVRRKTPDNPDAQALVADIINEAKMANAIVQEVLEFVRPVRLQVEPTAVVEPLTSAIALADSQARRGGCRVKVAVPDQLPRIRADRHQLTQVFANLIINAYQALDGKGELRIEARAAATAEEGALVPDTQHAIPSIVVDVIDSGPGIPVDRVEKVFQPFFTTKPQGSGLGLAIVRKIVDAHEGRIDLASPPGGGTCFRVTLPVEPSH
ncbi:MAG TPA: ATP-binding protein [Vicinamibacterales bacterium]|nr:ATP-binding protein [Vicinamibacterales bacterium]